MEHKAQQIVGKEAKNAFSDLRREKAVGLGVVGPSRIGKSTFLNWLTGSSAFSVSHSPVEIGTEGIWAFDDLIQLNNLRQISGVPAAGHDQKLLVLDAEGYGYDANLDNRYGYAKLMVSLLLSCEVLVLRLRHGGSNADVIRTITELTQWAVQIRQKCDWLTFGHLHLTLSDYGFPPTDRIALRNMYFTDEQIAMFKSVTVHCFGAPSRELEQYEYGTIKNITDSRVTPAYRQSFQDFVVTVTNQLGVGAARSVNSILNDIEIILNHIQEDVDNNGGRQTVSLWARKMQHYKKKALEQLEKVLTIPPIFPQSLLTENDLINLGNGITADFRNDMASLSLPTEAMTQLAENEKALQQAQDLLLRKLQEVSALRCQTAVSSACIGLDSLLSIEKWVVFKEEITDYFGRYIAKCHRLYAANCSGPAWPQYFASLKRILQENAQRLRTIYQTKRWTVDEAKWLQLVQLLNEEPRSVVEISNLSSRIAQLLGLSSELLF